MSKDTTPDLFFTNKNDEEHFHWFQKTYDIKRIIFGSVNEKLEDKFVDGVKICRFCKKTSDTVSFKQITHVIPQMLRRAKPISNFECDECNGLFSKFENDFSSHYMLHRAMFGHHKKKGGIVKLKTKDDVQIQGVKKTEEELTKLGFSADDIDRILNSNENIVKLIADPDDEGIEMTNDGNKLSITVLRQKYQPINVFKTLLKTGIAMIPQNEIDQYSESIELLFKDQEIRPLWFTVLQYELPRYNSYFNQPMLMHCDKKDIETNYPQKMFALFLDNKIIQFPIFSNSDFKGIREDKAEYIISPIPPILNPIVITSNKSDFNFHKEFARVPLFKKEMNSDDIIEGEYDQATILTQTNISLEKKNISIIKKQIVEENLDNQYYGFVLEPILNKENEIELKIIFDLMVPISDEKYGLIKSGSYYKINNQTKTGFVKDISYIEDVLLSTLIHTKKMFYQSFPDLKDLDVKVFSKTYFRNEIIRQLVEKEWLPEVKK